MITVRFVALAAIFSSLSLFTGCTSVKRSLGIERDAPDEFAVTPSDMSLEMPPDFHVLPVPNPGAPRPQEKKPLEKILGKQPISGPPTDGQKALLDLAGAGKEDHKTVRQTIDEESHIETGNKHVLERLGIQKKPKGDPLNAGEEAEALKKKGIARGPYTNEKKEPHP